MHELVKGPLDESISNYKESLAVVSFLFKVDKLSHPFIKKLRPHDFGHIEKINFAELLPKPATPEQLKEAHSTEHHTLLENPPPDYEPSFFHYKGSLTSPPCADVVNWIIHTEVHTIREAHLNSLKSVWQKHLGHDNFRDCQPICGRKVVRNVPYHHTAAHAHTLSPTQHATQVEAPLESQSKTI